MTKQDTTPSTTKKRKTTMPKKSVHKTKKSKQAADTTQEEITKGIEDVLTALFEMIGKASKWTVIAILALVAIALGVTYYLFHTVTDANANVEIDQRIGVTPTQIKSMKDIGQWEFLAIADEEMIDTIRNGFFTDDQLIRIYYGTLRLGIDMNDVQENWIEKEKDSIMVTLPPIKLLDEKFIDEARTQSFYESGKWTDADREAMYQRAYRKMKDRCLTKENIASAEDNATRQFYQLMRSMGHENIKVIVKSEE
jgi:hypothetical protein